MHWIDPNCLPQTQGKVEGFITNRDGEIDGIVLDRSAQAPLLVCTPPHLAAAIEAAIKVGDAISVRGVRPRRADIVAAVALTNANGAIITDDGPSHEDERKPDQERADHARTAMEAEGAVRLSLFGPKGELRGALLQDGTVIRIGPKEAAALVELLRPGSLIAVRGGGLHTKHGRVIAPKEIGPDLHSLTPVRAPKPKEKGKPKGHKDKPRQKKHEDDAPPRSGMLGRLIGA